MERKKITKIMSLLLAMILVLPMLGGADCVSITAQAKQKTLQTKEYQYSVKDGKVTILKYIGSKKKVTIPSKIAGKKVTAIGNNAFFRSTVEVVIVPEGVTKTGSAFEFCEKLKKVILPTEMREIGTGVFRSCENLKEVRMPKQIEKMGTYVFWRCSKLKEITLPNGIDEVPEATFMGCESLSKVNLPSSIRKIGRCAFYDCENLITIGDVTLDEVGGSAFRRCGKLSSAIVLTDCCTKIDSYTFAGCEQLKLTIPETATDIGEYAFAMCHQITRIVIPDEFIKIGVPDGTMESGREAYYEQIQCKFDMSAYAGCTGITEVVINDTNPVLVEENGIVYNKEKTDVLYVVPNYSGSMDFLQNVERIGFYAFTGSKLPKVIIPDNVMEIHGGVFLGAQTMNVTWSKNVETIPNGAFAYSNLTKLVIPEGVTTVDGNALHDCEQLKAVSFPASFEKFTSWSIFYGTPALKKITVAKDNPKYYTKNGILFKKKNGADMLLCYPAGKKGTSYTVPKNVVLGTYCFDSLTYLKKVTLQNGGAETTIDSYFSNCNGVTVEIPKTVVKFPSTGHASDFPLFTNCKNCKALVYKNSAAHKYFKRVKDSEGFPYKVISGKKK